MKYLLIICLGFCSFWVKGQVSNDECSAAIILDDVNNYCSGVGQFNNIGATPSTVNQVGGGIFCWSDANNDVWFQFVATATDINVRVIGDIAQTPGGTIKYPQFAVYSGRCATGLTMVSCNSDQAGSHVAESYGNNLIPGRQYYIRVGGRGNNTGTFTLCINNFFNVPAPQSDCPQNIVLCDKAGFSVNSLIGTGLNNTEVSTSCIDEERSSAWYSWTCKDPGSLTFTITPSNPIDDIDFVVYELPNGVKDCTGKFERRCEAAGENIGAPLATWERCMGPTGLSDSESDTSEPAGCGGNNNNFVSALNMEAGKSYAILINNYSRSGNGFNIAFGGTGTFLGPEADFEILDESTPFCRFQEYTVVDTSRLFGTRVISYQWGFGDEAVFSSDTGRGPHKVTFPLAGIKTIFLSLETEDGCRVYKKLSIDVLCCDKSVIVDAGPDQTIKLGESTQLSGFASLPGQDWIIRWLPGDHLSCINCWDPIAMPYHDFMYILTVQDDEQCSGRDTVLIRINKYKPLYIPNAFSPNGDGINDRFNAYAGIALKQIRKLRIFDRWGDLVYETSNIQPGENLLGWDGKFQGKEMNPGVFVYHIVAEFLDDSLEEYAGALHLIR
ncbi:MAG: gliding motility-associated C-terminal domain-containing protein [Saprospiraceae bacterium]|nr:gliding motility-associated C-terminal domain-containing protein [Saprospiraceae bacterium]